MIGVIAGEVEHHAVAVPYIDRRRDGSSVEIVTAKINDQCKPAIQIVAVGPRPTNYDQAVRSLPQQEHLAGHSTRRRGSDLATLKQDREPLEPFLVAEASEHLRGSHQCTIVHLVVYQLAKAMGRPGLLHRLSTGIRDMRGEVLDKQFRVIEQKLSICLAQLPQRLLTQLMGLL
ncbi:MAG: hypothetical protein E6K69_08075 [Nitrospirae bacterium]|nr:MAG: hypothetical protein E6K69_08075 [Nitrospirota bacterium]